MACPPVRPLPRASSVRRGSCCTPHGNLTRRISVQGGGDPTGRRPRRRRSEGVCCWDMEGTRARADPRHSYATTVLHMTVSAGGSCSRPGTSPPASRRPTEHCFAASSAPASSRRFLSGSSAPVRRPDLSSGASARRCLRCLGPEILLDRREPSGQPHRVCEQRVPLSLSLFGYNRGPREEL